MRKMVLLVLSILTFEYLIASVIVTIDIRPKDLLKKFKLDNPNKIMLGHLNINLIGQKCVVLNEIIEDKINILLALILFSQTGHYVFKTAQLLLLLYLIFIS